MNRENMTLAEIDAATRPGRYLVGISAYQSGRPLAVNHGDHIALLARLRLEPGVICFAQATGSYEGETERSVMVVVDREGLDNMRQLARELNQESILIATRSEAAGPFAPLSGRLEFESMETVELGELTQITARRADEEIAWTWLDGKAEWPFIFS